MQLVDLDEEAAPEQQSEPTPEAPRRGPGRFAARNQSKPKPVWAPAKKKPVKYMLAKVQQAIWLQSFKNGWPLNPKIV